MIIIDLLRDYLFRILALAVGLAGFRYLNKPFRILLLWISITLVVDLVGRNIRLSRPNLDLYYYYLLIEGFLQWIVAMYYFKGKRAAGLLWLSLIAFTGVWAYELVQRNFPAIADAHLVESVLLVIFYLIVLLRVINQPKASTLRSNPYFWLSLGIIIYNAGCIPCWAMFGHLQPDPKTATQYFVFINNPLAAIQYLMIAISFYMFYRNAKQESEPKDQSLSRPVHGINE